MNLFNSLKQSFFDAHWVSVISIQFGSPLNEQICARQKYYALSLTSHVSLSESYANRAEFESEKIESEKNSVRKIFAVLNFKVSKFCHIWHLFRTSINVK